MDEDMLKAVKRAMESRRQQLGPPADETSIDTSLWEEFARALENDNVAAVADLAARMRADGRDLICERVDVRDRDHFRESGDTALHLAAACNADSAVEFLIAQGADLNARNDCGDTSLHRAAENGGADTCTLLLAAGADVDARNESGNTALHYVLFAHDRAMREHPWTSIPAAVQFPIASHGQLVGAQARWRIDLVGTLLERGADPRIPNAVGERAVDLVDEEDTHGELAAMLTAKAQELDLRDRAAARLAGAESERGGGL